MSEFTELVGVFRDFLWNHIIAFVLLGAGVYFTCTLRFLQFRHFFHLFTVIRRSMKTEEGGVSSFGAYCTSLAARVGTGNIAGVALAIKMGGPGAIFWMWCVAMLGMATGFVESTLAQLYKLPDRDGIYRGGPAYYMEKGLKQRWMGILFSFLLLFAYGLVFNAVQSNSISDSVHLAFGIPKWGIAAGLVLVSGVVIFGGVRRIVTFAQWVVPVMAVMYLLLAFYVVFVNITEVPDVIMLVLTNAFGVKQAAGGAVGYAVSQAISNGVRRGLFSNEAGMGSAPNAAATAETKHPANQGYVQMLGVFTDTIIICSATAAMILISGAYTHDLNGVNITQKALSEEVGVWGDYFIAVAIFFFAFTSVIANYYYGEVALRFLKGIPESAFKVYRFVVLGMVVFGAFAKAELVWDLADISMGMMALVNLVAIILLSPIAIRLAVDYNRQIAGGTEPVFDLDNFPKLKDHIHPDSWK